MITSGTFAITTATTSVKLRSDRTGQLLFTVTNTSGRQLTVRGIVVTPQGPTQKAWFVIEGQPERASAPNTSLDYKVNIAVPAEAPAGPVIMRFDAIGVENPDAYASQGPTVVIDVPPTATKKKPFPWWIVVVAAAAVLLIGGGAGFAWYAVHNNLFASKPTPSPSPSPSPVNPIDKFVGTWTLNNAGPKDFSRIDIVRQGQAVAATFYYGCQPTCSTLAGYGTYAANPESITFNVSFTSLGTTYTYTAVVYLLSTSSIRVDFALNGTQYGSYFYTRLTGKGCQPACVINTQPVNKAP